MELSDQDLETLTYTLLGEARGEGAEGMLAVANVIRNRMDSPIYPDDPVEVATQPWQFSTNNGPNMGGGNQTATRREVRPGDPLYTAAERIVRGAILAETPTLPDITGRAINYHANSISPRWASGATTRWGTVQINNHTFYARQPVPPLDIPSVLSMIDTDAGPSWMSNARQFSETRAEQRIIRATERADQRRRMFEAAGGASVGSTTSTAMSVTSELGGGKGFAGSIARQVIPSEDYAKARDLASFGTLLDERVSMTAPVVPLPVPSDAVDLRPVPRGWQSAPLTDDEVIQIGNPMEVPPQKLRPAYGSDDLGSVPPAVRTFVGTVLGNKSGITERDFTSQEMLLLENAVRRAEMNGRNYIHYVDYNTAAPPDLTSQTAVGDHLLSQGIGNTAGSLAATLGRAKFQRMPDGSVIITDRYDFSSNSMRYNSTAEQIKERGLAQTFMDNFVEGGAYGLAHTFGEIAAPEGEGRRVSIRIAPDAMSSGQQGRSRRRPGAPGSPANDFNTKLSAADERKFQEWKSVNAPDNSGDDYDLRGAFKSGAWLRSSGQWPETFKKPNHPTFSAESQYARWVVPAGAVKVKGGAAGAAGASAAARGAATASNGLKPLPAPAPLTFGQPKTRTADSGLVTYIRKTVPIDAYGNPVPDATLVVAPVAKKSPTVRLAEAKVKAGAAVAALGAVKVVPKVSAVAAGAGSAMASAAGKVSAGRLKAGSPNTDINPAVKENPFVYVPKFAADQDATDSAVPMIRPKAPAPAVQSNALRLARMRADPPGSFPKVTELAAFRTEGAGTRTAEEMLNGTGYEKLGAALDTMKAPAANGNAPIPRPASERPKVKLSAGADIVKPGKVSTQTVAPQPMPAGARPQAKPTVKAPTPMPAAARPKAKPVVTAAPVRKPAPSSTSTMADTAIKATIRGTSNAGRTYEVGKTYTAAGYTYVAKSDGTFQKTGKV